MMALLLLLLWLVLFSSACQISGKQIGYCSTNPLSSLDFCTKVVDNYICLPAHNKTWSEYNVFYKDKEIKRLVLGYLQDKLNSEYLQGGTLQISNNPGCYEAYKQFSCRWNFPTCSRATNSSLQMCQSVCNNFQTACGGSTNVCSIIYAKTDLGLNSQC